jgi:hypothetical protein
MESRCGVVISLLPKQPISPYPRSSAMIRMMLGLVSFSSGRQPNIVRKDITDKKNGIRLIIIVQVLNRPKIYAGRFQIKIYLKI